MIESEPAVYKASSNSKMPRDPFQDNLSIATFVRKSIEVLKIFRSGQSLRREIHSLQRDPEVAAVMASIRDRQKLFACSEAVCLVRYAVDRQGFYRSDYARLVIAKGEFRVEQWSEARKLNLKSALISRRKVTVLQTRKLGELAREGVTADEVRSYILASRSKESPQLVS